MVVEKEGGCANNQNTRVDEQRFIISERIQSKITLLSHEETAQTQQIATPYSNSSPHRPWFRQ